jgi:hypothetical protein
MDIPRKYRKYRMNTAIYESMVPLVLMSRTPLGCEFR